MSLLGFLHGLRTYAVYNIDFDIVALIIYIVALSTYFQKRHVSNNQHKVFLGLCLSAFLTPLLDIPATILIEIKASASLVYLVNNLYYVAKCFISFFYLLYIISYLETMKNSSWFLKLAVTLPIGFIIIMIIINPFTGWVYKYKDGVYTSGILRAYVYGLTLFYFGWAVIYTIIHRQYYRLSFRKIIYIISFINISLHIFQFLHASIHIHSLAFSLSILLLVINIEKFGMVIDYNSGMGKKEHLLALTQKFIHNVIPFDIVLIRISDYDLLTNRLGFAQLTEMLAQIERYIKGKVEKGYAFKLGEGYYALLEKDTVSEEKLKAMYSDLCENWTVGDLEVSSEFWITSVNFPEEIPDTDSLTSYIQVFEKHEQPSYGILNSDDLQISDSVRKKEISRAIQDGLKNKTFEVYYQPICTAKDQKFVTAEALLRLKDPLLGFISPNEFIPISEQEGLIIDIGEYVLDSVCKFIENHDMEKLGLEYIEVNLSAIQCLQPNLIEVIQNVVSKHHIENKYLCFEITETASNCAPLVFSQNLKLLNEKGFILALDDFGTGYGNLQRMITSDFKIIKFDKQMTQRLSSEVQLRRVYKTLQAMISTMGSHVVSEGVETKEQYEFVRDAGAGYIQGFYFSKPLQVDEFVKFLEEKQS